MNNVGQLGYNIEPITDQRNSHIQLIGDPLSNYLKLINEKDLLILNPFNNKNNITNNDNIININKNYENNTVNTPNEMIVSTWLSCSFCGHKTDESIDLEKHLEEHKNDDYDDDFDVEDIKYEIDKFDEDIDLIGDEKMVEFVRNNVCRVKDPLKDYGNTATGIHQTIYKQFSILIKKPNEIKPNTIYFKPYQCNWCNYKTVTNRKLLEHMTMHTGERPYRCKSCGYATRNASALSYHLKTHNEDRPFKCNLCNYRNTTLSSLRSHKTRVHFSKGFNGIGNC